MSVNDGSVGATATTATDGTTSVPVTVDNQSTGVSTTPSQTSEQPSSSSSSSSNSSDTGSLKGLFSFGNLFNNSSSGTQDSTNSNTSGALKGTTVSIADPTPSTSVGSTTPSTPAKTTGYTVNSLGYTTMPDGTIRYVGTQGNTIVNSSNPKTTSSKNNSSKSSSTKSNPSKQMVSNSSSNPKTAQQSQKAVTIAIDDTPSSQTSTAQTSSLLPYLVPSAQNGTSSGLSNVSLQWEGIHTGSPTIDSAISTAAAVPLAAAQTLLGK